MREYKPKINKGKDKENPQYQKPKLIKLNRIQRRITACPAP